jgi:hypothetical protein
MEVLKNGISLLQAFLPFLEKRFELLPINPGLRNNVLLISVLFAATAGLGGYQQLKRSKKAVIAWFALAGAVVSVMLIFALTGGITFSLSPLAISWAVQICYILVFLFFGLAIGGFAAVI